MPSSLRHHGLMLLPVVAGLYLALVAVGCASYRSILYPAPHDGPPAAPPGATLRRIPAADGATVHALFFPAPQGAPTLVHFHGNGESLRTATPLAEDLHARGLGVMLVEYRGYGASEGAPSEDGFYLDAEAALAALAQEGVSRERIVVSGVSLGTGVAAEMAARGHGARLVLISPYTSIPAVAGRFAPFLPMSLIVGDKFDTLGKAGKIGVPTLVIHGDQDELVPYDMGRSVAGAIEGAQLVTITGGHHNDLFAQRRDLMSVIAGFALQKEPR